MIGSIKSITKFLGDVVDGFKGVGFINAIGKASPWLDAVGSSVGEALPPVKFFLSLHKELTAVNDPNELAEIAFSISYQFAVKQSAAAIGEPERPIGDAAAALARLKALGDAIPSDKLDFSRISYDNLLLHPFVLFADDILASILEDVGYNEVQRRKFITDLHNRFSTQFKTLISHGETREKFAPLRDRLAAGTDDKSAKAALLEHAEYQRSLFEERPVFGKEVFTLRDVYIDTECGVLTWGDIADDQRDKRKDPFKEENGGRHRLGETVFKLLGDPNFRDAIVIQGVAGSGKSAFTQWLSAELIRKGLKPIRVLLRDVRLERDRPIKEALGEALRYDDETQRKSAGYPRPDDAFDEGKIFKESVKFGDTEICPYVLILDGWDEISISVSEGFKQRLDKMLERVRDEFLGSRSPLVRVILTGRPSPDFTGGTFLLKNTPFLTLRTLNPHDLEAFIKKLSYCIANPLKGVEGTGWPSFNADKFAPIVEKYRDEEKRLEVFELPLLALLAIRLLSEEGADVDAILASPTVLYRNLVDLTCSGGKYVDSGEVVEQKHRLKGAKLRDLLRRTATAITVYGDENISYAELSLRLKDAIEDLGKTVDKLAGENVLSQLMIAYFFKGGHEDLGCEFLHKSFREYFFAEGIVETLKRYGAETAEAPAPRTPYWKDFDEVDARFRFSRAIGEQASAQWLTPEVVKYVGELLEWEIARSFGQPMAVIENAQPTDPIEFERWPVVRDALADLWDWWAQGVHIRPQPVFDRKHNTTYETVYAQELIEHAMPFNVPKGDIPVPLRVVTMDAHLGDALFRLSVWTHFFIARATGWLGPDDAPRTAAELWEGAKQGARNAQTMVGAWTLFAPAGDRREFWPNFVARINGAGWRPVSAFPGGCDLRACDLAEASLRGQGIKEIDWSFANLSRCNADNLYLGTDILFRTLLADVSLMDATLPGAFECDFSGSYLSGVSEVFGATLSRCSFVTCDLFRARLDGWFDECNFDNADLGSISLEGGHFENCSFDNTKLEYVSNLVDAIFDGVNGLPIISGTLLMCEHTKLPDYVGNPKIINVDAIPYPEPPPSSETPEEPPDR